MRAPALARPGDSAPGFTRRSVAVMPGALRAGRAAQRPATGTGSKGQRRLRWLLPEAGLAAVAHADGEGGVQAGQLLGGEGGRQALGRIQRLQLALQDSRLLSRVSMVRNEAVVTAATCAGVPASNPVPWRHIT